MRKPVRPSRMVLAADNEISHTVAVSVEGLAWDDPIGPKNQEKFTKTFKKIEILTNRKIARWTGKTNGDSFELIGFCDSSADAYVAVIYCRTKFEGNFNITLLTAKGHVVPLKQHAESKKETEDIKILKEKINNDLTIPKLELLSLNLLMELYQETVKTLYAITSEAVEPVALTPFMLCMQRNLQSSPLDRANRENKLLTHRYTLLKKLRKELWDRFRSEYLGHLQKRYKWKTTTRNARVGDVVLVKELNSPPNQWPIGIITRCLPDETGTVRRVEVKTSQREYAPRATCQLIPLLTEDEDREFCSPCSPQSGESSLPEVCLEPRALGPAPTKRKETVGSPAVPLATYEEPRVKPRRSPRLKSDMALITHVLLCWLAYTKPTNAFDIHPVEREATTFRIGSVFCFAFDLDFALRTSVNVTRDLGELTEQSDALEQFCKRAQQEAMTTVVRHCFTLHRAVLTETL